VAFLQCLAPCLWHIANLFCMFLNALRCVASAFLSGPFLCIFSFEVVC
jgi:hypothetical protein